MFNTDAFRIAAFTMLIAAAIGLAIYLLVSARDRDERRRTALKLLRLCIEKALESLR
ncbi:hypothetical protein KK090_02510 [Curtobacterium flaccumfaciens pv. poinsettiae]|uniref:hypothetical protein n=1 Tax=Curtobacterium poinsettiae TaxID=159612 RepID=UPI001BE0868D|nr:hypothetical protein [Curtobacterium flaccumfaciens]MBT1618120.1 hypothetical protein [Curtobacterium flaccumfaciens pv. poinsettiae]